MCLAQMPAKPVPSRSAEVSKAPNPEVITNLSQLGRRDALRQWDDELTKALGGALGPKSSLDGVFAPAYRPQVAVNPAKRAKEEEDRRKSWMIMNPGETLPSTGADGENPFQSSGANNTRQDRRKTSLEQLYEQLNSTGENGAASALSAEENGAGRRKSQNISDDKQRDEDQKLPSEVKSTADRLTKLLGTEQKQNGFPQASFRGSWSDPFGLGKNSLTEDESKAHKDFIDQYRQMLDRNTGASTSDPLSRPNPLNPSGVPTPPGYMGGLETVGKNHFSDNLTTAGMVTAPLRPATLPDQNATVLNQWNPLYAPPRPEPSKTAPISVPTMEAPRRKF